MTSEWMSLLYILVSFRILSFLQHDDKIDFFVFKQVTAKDDVVVMSVRHGSKFDDTSSL